MENIGRIVTFKDITHKAVQQPIMKQWVFRTLLINSEK